jgi:hypothetical protein
MRTSLNKIKAIDDFLHRKITKPDAIVFEVQMLLCDNLAEEVQQQQKAYDIIQLYSRNSIKNEIGNAYKILATSPKYRSFMRQIEGLFKSS